MHFTNGEATAFYKTNYEILAEGSFRNSVIGADRTIRQVSVKEFGNSLSGLRLIDERGVVQVDLEWSEKGEWMYQEIAEDEVITGVYGCKSKSKQGFIRSIGFIVRKK